MKARAVKDFIYFVTLTNSTAIKDIRIIDHSLNALKKIDFSQILVNLATFENNLFVMSSNANSFNILTSYNSNLDVSLKVGQENATLPFYFSKIFTMFLVSEKYFILAEKQTNSNQQIALVNKTNGHIQKTFSVYSFGMWSVYLDKYLVLHIKGSKYIRAIDLDLDGNNLDDTWLDSNLGVNVELNSVLNKKLCFLDASKCSLYIF